MCGIVGRVLPTGEVDPLVLAKGVRAISHRGPDGQGQLTVSVGECAVELGHTRLSILDLSPSGAQPMESADGRWALVFNGEIYNHRELRWAREWTGSSDTETLVECLARDGVSATLGRLNGMFAFAAVDRRERKLWLVRDPFGIKPLYTTQMPDGGLAFASEVGALRAMGTPAGRDLDPSGLQAFLALRYVPSPGTLWSGVSRVSSGHLLCVDLSTGLVSERRYIHPTRERFSGSFEEATSEWAGVLGGAVRRQILSDVPVGILLSGGVDSALVAAMARPMVESLPAFTIGFGSQHPDCEIDDAAMAARLLGLDHRVVEVGPDDLLQTFDATVRAVEEPLGTTSSLIYAHLTRKAREEVTVVLTGQGADEPWLGYRRYQFEWLRQHLGVPRLPTRHLLRYWRGGTGDVRRTLAALGEGDVTDRYMAAGQLFDAVDRGRLTGRTDDGGAGAVADRWMGWSGARGVEAMAAVDTRCQLGDDLLLYGDKISMAVGLEARVPMLDLEVVRFVESLPLRFKRSRRGGKLLHKTMVAEYLPKELVDRPKRGFQVPYGEWLRTVWRDPFSARLLDASSPLRDVLDARPIQTIWRRHQSGEVDASRELFALASLEVLLR